MAHDNRYDAAVYYDHFSEPPGDDVSFYLGRLGGNDARVLELGCGTGRVMLPFAKHAGYVCGVDISTSMLAICNNKLAEAQVPGNRARTLQADITTLDLTADEAGFDRICAPFRVMQNLESDEQVDGLMRVIKRHLEPGGEAVLNTFRPRGGYDELAAFWDERQGDKAAATFSLDGDKVQLYEDCRIYKDNPVRVYPKLIYKRYNPADEQIEQAVLDIVMRVWQPDELLGLIERHGFTVTERLGGYGGEAWGEGPELVVAFTHA